MAWVVKRQMKAGTRYLAGYMDPIGKQRSAGAYRTRGEAAQAGAAAKRKVSDSSAQPHRREGRLRRVRRAELVAQPAPPRAHHQGRVPQQPRRALPAPLRH